MLSAHEGQDGREHGESARHPASARPRTAPGDLRRRHRRELVDELTGRAAWLSRSDQWLIDAVFREGRHVAEVAAVRGEVPRKLRRHVRRLVRRLRSDKFKFVVSQSRQWPSQRRRIAWLCFVEGQSQRQVASQLRLTLHAVRRHCEVIHALYEAASDGPASVGGASLAAELSGGRP